MRLYAVAAMATLSVAGIAYAVRQAGDKPVIPIRPLSGKETNALIRFEGSQSDNENWAGAKSLSASDVLGKDTQDKYIKEAAAFSGAWISASDAYIASADPAVTSAVLGTVLKDYEANHFEAKSAPQASQVAVETAVKLQAIQVGQNARIIALLEKLTAQKTGK